MFNPVWVSMIRSIALFSLLLTVSCIDSRETKLQRFLLKGNEMMKQGNDQQAAHYYYEALKIDSCFVDAHNNLGTLYFNQQKYVEAITHYSSALECRSDYLAALFNRTNAFYESGENFRALEDLEKIRKIKPDTSSLHFASGLVHTKLRNFEEAQQDFLRVLKISPDNNEARINLGTVLYYKRDFMEARNLLKEALSDSTGIINTYNTLALIEVETDNLQQAMYYVSKALEIAPSDAFSLNNRGYIYLLNNRLEDALADIDRSIITDPSNAWAYRNKGIYYLRVSDFENAVRLLTQAKQMNDFVEGVDVYLAEARKNLAK